MKVKASVRSLARKDGSYVVRRRGHLYVINKKNPPLEGEARLMALPKYKASRANTHSRRANWKAKVPQLATVRTPEGEVVQVPQNLAAAVRKGYMKP